MLKIIDITKAYAVDKQESVLALKGVSIEFRRNEFVSILGPSGCGKTTLLNIIGGLDRYTSGDIQIEGISTKEYDDVDWDTYRNRRIGFVFQSYNLIPHMNIMKNVALSLTLAGVEKEERYRRAMEALEKVGLADQAKKKPNQLSGGQMQRVAIARALVNNPEIILADEPTGALDSESGLQVMDLLKEVANDRLVIMVTHNPTLAETYSTRIVYLKDGQVDGDTMPYDSSVEPEGELPVDAEPEQAEQAVEEIEFVDADAKEGAVSDEQEAESEKPAKKKSRFCNLFRKRRAQGKTAMKLHTAISLSWNNLLSKKGRTIITSVAGSIGIIGIILVLSLSTGAKAYVSSLEESMLSNYPISVSESRADLASLLSIILEDEEKKPSNPDSTTITTRKILGKFMDGSDTLKQLMSQNDLKKFRAYIEENFDKSLATVRYNYGLYFNAFIEDPLNDTRADEDKIYMKVNPYTETMESIITNLPAVDFGGMSLNDLVNGATNPAMSLMMGMMMPGINMFSAWSELSSNQKLLDSQYELVGSESKWPTEADEIVIVVDNKNQLVDFQLFMLGLKSEEDVIKAFSGEKSYSDDATYDVSDLLKLRYKVLTEADYLKDNGDGTWTQVAHAEKHKNVIDTLPSSIELKVVGVIRPKPGVTSGSISGVYGYTEALTNLLIEKANAHPAIKEILRRVAEDQAKPLNEMNGTIISPITFNGYGDNKKISLKAGDTIVWYDGKTDNNIKKSYVSLLRALGVVELDDPTNIEFYCTSFEAKEEIISFINQYNEEQRAEAKANGTDADEIKYSDTLATMMSFVNTMANTITGVLVAFAAISLVVSTIMIAIIIYTSVLERRKEIGVLRSIGARKKDISRVFLAESAILGAYSGLIGLLVSYLISLLGAFVLKVVFEIDGLIEVKWWHCVMMLGISVLLSMLAGFIPSRIAAKKDPAIALRSE